MAHEVTRVTDDSCHPQIYCSQINWGSSYAPDLRPCFVIWKAVVDNERFPCWNTMVTNHFLCVLSIPGHVPSECCIRTDSPAGLFPRIDTISNSPWHDWWLNPLLPYLLWKVTNLREMYLESKRFGLGFNLWSAGNSTSDTEQSHEAVKERSLWMPGSEVEVPTISGEWGKGKALLKVVQMFFAIADLVEVLHICPGHFTPWIYMWSLSEDSGFNPLWRTASVSRLVCGLEETEGLLFDISTPLLFWPFLTWMMHTVRSREREASAEQFTGKVRVFETNAQSNWNITQPTHKVLFPTWSAMGELLKVQKFPFGTAHKSTM